MRAFVNRITCDRWNGVLCENDEIDMPSIDDLNRAVEALNSATRTLVFLNGQNGSHLAIGGGAGRYVVYVSTSDEDFWNLVADKNDSAGQVMLNAGGQEGDYPVRQVVDKLHALQAAHKFFKTGELDPSLKWEKQS